MARSRRTLVGVAVALVVVLAAAAFAVWWFFIRDDSPPPADIDSASETLQETGGEDVDEDGIEGRWAVDTSVGAFDDFSGTWAGYRIDEELGDIGSTTAVGRTPDVTGTMSIQGDEVTAVNVEVDMTTLQSDQSRRDGQLRGRGLQTDDFPTAAFELAEPLALPEGIESGEPVSTTVLGELTLHGVTNEVEVTLDATLTGDRAVIVGSAPVVLTDYDIEAPTGGFVLGVADQGQFEFQVFFSQQP
jgi:polyisoprenoid-binding protein YceI